MIDWEEPSGLRAWVNRLVGHQPAPVEVRIDGKRYRVPKPDMLQQIIDIFAPEREVHDVVVILR